MDSDLFFRLIEQISSKLDELSRSTDLVKGEVGAIKTRLFNGLTDTTRETYAKVLVLEKSKKSAMLPYISCRIRGRKDLQRTIQKKKYTIA